MGPITLQILCMFLDTKKQIGIMLQHQQDTKCEDCTIKLPRITLVLTQFFRTRSRVLMKPAPSVSPSVSDKSSHTSHH